MYSVSSTVSDCWHIARREDCGNVFCGFCFKLTAKGVCFMALWAVHVTAIFSATWTPSGDLGPRSTPIRSIFAVLPVSAAVRCFGWLLRHLSLPWATDVLLCWQTKKHDMRLAFVINLCVLEQTLQEPNAYSYLESSETEICCVLDMADLSDWKFSFQNSCKYLVRLFVFSINFRRQISVYVKPAPLWITGWLQISRLLGRIAIFNWVHVWSFCYFEVASTCSSFLPHTCLFNFLCCSLENLKTYRNAIMAFD